MALIRKIGAWFAAAAGWIAFGAACVFFCLKIKFYGDKNPVEKAEKAKEEKRNEIEKTPAADCINQSSHAEQLAGSIRNEQEQFKQCARDTINQKLVL